VPKSTNVEISFRVAEVKEQLLQGHTRAFIVQAGSKKWGITERQVDDYIAKAKEIINEINIINTVENMGIISSNMWKVYREALQANDTRLMLDTLREIGKLRGLYNDKITMYIDSERPLKDLSDEDLDKIIQQERIENEQH
jgi:hypothetical protein